MSGCLEYQNLSRRRALTALAGLVPSWVPMVQYEHAASTRPKGGTRDLILTIYLRGGMDGLTTCLPYGDPNYYALRPNIGVPRPDSVDKARRAINLDGFFGVPQAMSPVADLFNAGVLAFVHGSGSTDPTRSHFDAQHFMEAGSPDTRLWTGWLGRHLAMVSPTNSNATIRAMALGGQLPLTLEGAPQTISATRIEDFQLGGDPTTLAKRTAFLQTAYADAEAMMKDAATTTIKTMGLLQGINFGSYVPGGGAKYTDSLGGDGNGFLTSMKAAAALIKKQIGIEAIHIDMGGWDTHIYEDPFGTYGLIKQQMDFLARGLAAFYADVNAANLMGSVTVVVMSEFGRAAKENGNAGTDHGHGNCMILMGNNVNGKKVYRNKFSLDQSALSQGRDLQVNIDYRLVLSEVLQKRLLNTAVSTIFPNYTPGTLLGVCKP